MEGGGFFPFGGDPEEILRGLRDFAEQQAEGVKETQREQFATLTLSTAVDLTQAARARVEPSGSLDEQAIQARRKRVRRTVTILVVVVALFYLIAFMQIIMMK